MGLAAVLAIAGFTFLGSIFQYPQILEEPTADILSLYRAHQGAVTAWFLALAISAALLAPTGLLLGRLTGGRLGRWIAGIGVAAATVQVVGLQRWATLVPGISHDALDPSRRAAAEDRFELLHVILGKVIGETFGYALTATFTILVVVALTRTVLPRWLALLGYVAAVLIATGIVIPVIDAASLTNFAGYVAWCVWLIAVAVALFRVDATGRSDVHDQPERAQGPRAPGDDLTSMAASSVLVTGGTGGIGRATALGLAGLTGQGRSFPPASRCPCGRCRRWLQQPLVPEVLLS
jgi:hypothetical protein